MYTDCAGHSFDWCFPVHLRYSMSSLFYFVQWPSQCDTRLTVLILAVNLWLLLTCHGFIFGSYWVVTSLCGTLAVTSLLTISYFLLGPVMILVCTCVQYIPDWRIRSLVADWSGNSVCALVVCIGSYAKVGYCCQRQLVLLFGLVDWIMRTPFVGGWVWR